MNIEAIVKALPTEALTTVTDLPFPKVAEGKVREIYDVGDNLLMITTDRISAYDVIMPDGIPGKGVVLTQIARFWFEQSKGLIENHLVENHDEELAKVLKGYEDLIPRSMLVKKLNPLAVEAIVRGYISGSGWSDYKKTGKLFGQEAPAGLVESQKFPQPYFTPTTKANEGHDEPISLEECEALLGKSVYEKVLKVSLELYNMGVEVAAKAGIILADTKFEFGLDSAGKLFLIDEVLTPDSSRFWPADEYKAGKGQPSFDKQFVRDYLSGLDWDKTPPGPKLPEEVIHGTRERYVTALAKLAAI
jgi:phosphoribosylaminoimidazole-succinocarboxamide synthase